MSDLNTEQEIRDYLAQQADWLNRGIIDQTQYNQAVRDTKVGIKGYAAQLQASQEQLKKSVVGLASSIAKGDSGAKVYNNALNAGAKAIDSWSSKYGFWGKVAGTVATAAAKYVAAVNEQSDLLFENYQELSRSGLANGMDDAFKNLQKMGYTTKEIGQMGSLMKENSQLMAQFGGTAAGGAKDFANLSKEIQYSDLGSQFKMMGMTVNDINKGSANYLKLQQMSGTLGSQNAQDIAKSSAAYIVQQDRMTKLTGASADEQNKILEDAYRQERYAAKQYQLRVLIGTEESKKQADANDAYLQMMTKQGGEANGKRAQAMIVGAANDPEYQKAKRVLPEANSMIRAGGNDAAQTFDQSVKDAKKTQTNWNMLAQAGKSGDVVGDYASTTVLAGHAKSMEESAKIAEADLARQRAGEEGKVANQVKIRNSQRNMTMTAELGVNKGVDLAGSGMATLSEGLEKATNVLGKLVGIDKGGERVGGNGSSGGGSSAPASGGSSGGGTGASAPTTPTPPAKSGSTPGASVAPAAGGAAGVGTASAVNSTPGEKGSAGGESGGVVGAAKSAVGKAGGAMVAGMDAIKQMIIKHEGIRTKPYQDSLGLWTVGVGHLIGDGKSLPADMNREFSKDEVMSMFETDFAHHYKIAQNTPGWDKASETAKGAMIDLAFNMGQWWKKFPATAKALASGDWSGAAAGLRDSKWASQVGGRASTVTGMIEQGGAGAAGKMQTAAMGGVLGGPKSGYTAMLHGTEAVVPLPDGKTIPVQMAGGDSSQEQIDLLSVELEKLDAMVRMINKQNDLATRILQKQS